MTKVFYNHSCNICRKEIELYQKMPNDITWIDIQDDRAKETKLDDDQLLRRLHVTEDGKLYKGAKAFLVLWSKLPKMRLFYLTLKLPIIYHLFAFFYEIAAYFLYLKNKKN